MKTKHNNEINYFHTETESVNLMAHSTNAHSLPFNTAHTESLESPFDRRTEGQQISTFNIID